MTSEGATSVQVAVRIKPITDEDLEKLPTRFQRQVITTPSPHQIVVEGEKRQFYHFDHVFPPETTQEEIYEKSVENLVDKFLEGYNVTILAYGQTSSGKTHTMGTADNSSIPYHNKGIIPRAIATLFHTMNTSSLYMNRKFSIKVSFIEIYNEDLIDLLGEGEGESRPQVMIREDSKGHIYWSGLQELQVNSVDDVIAYLARGSLNRQVGATDMNAKSSRSHAIFSLTMSQQKLVNHNGYNNYSNPGSRPTTPSSKLMGSRANSRLDSRFDDESDWITITSKFHFVDLAGSERLKRTAASGDRAKEGISINSGLLALGNVISALGDPNKAKHTTHIPYRDSKLTRLLQDSLGGNAQTLMIACVSPAEFNLNETVNTLKYANRARNIKNSAAINQEETGWNDIIHLQNLVVKLRSEISNLKVALSNANSNNGTLSPGRTTPVEGISRIKSPTAGYYSSIPTGRVTPTPGIPTGRSTPTASGIPTGRSTPTTSGIPNGRSTPTSGIPGPSGIPGRSTPTSGIPGPSGIPGRSTPTSGIPGRNTPTKSGISSGIPGRTTPTSGGIPSVITRRTSRPSRPSSPLTTFSHGNYLANNSKDTEAMEDELMQLRASYAELSRKYAKTSAELAMHQDNNPDELHNLKGPVIEEYEKSISSLESNLAMTIAALTHAENALKEIEERNAMLEKNQEQTKSLNNNLQKYIKELESKRDTETKVVTAREDHSEKFVSEAVKVLEERLRDREAAYKELEEKLKRSGVDQEKHVLLNKIDSKDKRISFLDSKLTQLGDEVDKLRRLENKQNSSTMNFYNMSERDQLTIKSLESKLRQTETELDEAKLKYQELQSRLDNSSEFTATPITPMTPMTPATPHNEYNNNNINGSTKLGVHRKAKSLSADLKSENHSAIIEKLQFELKLFESFNKDKQQSLDAVKRELNHLEIDYQETLQLVNDLQEELKKRDGISNSEPANSSNSQLLQEVEKLKEKEKQLLQNIEVHETEHKKHVEEIERLESNIRDLRKQMTEETSDDKNEELMILREYVANNKDYENIIKRLEDELREVKESHNQEKKSTTSSKDNSITNNDESSADKLEQNVDENVIALESTVKNLENKLSSLNLDIKNKDNIIEKELENKGLLQKHLKDKETEVAILTKQLMDLRKQDDDVQRRMKELQAQLGSVKEINKSLESDLDNIKNELKVVKENEAQALEQLQVLDAEELKLQQELAQLRNTEITQRERIAVLEAQLSEKGAQIDNELINVKSELAISKESEITNKETIAQLTKNISEIDNELTNVQSELAISKESEVANKKMIAELESELSKSESIITSLQSNIEISNSNENEINETLVKLRKELSDTKSEMESQNELLTELGNQLTTTEKEREQYSERINELSRIIEERENQLTTTENELNQYSERINELSRIIEARENQLTTTEKEREQYSERINELSRMIEERENQLTTTEKERDQYSERINELSRMIEERENQLTTTEKERDQYSERVNDQSRMMDQQKEEVEAFELTITNLENELKDTKTASQTYQDKMKSLGEKLSDLESQLDEAKASNEEHVRMINNLDSTLKESNIHLSEKEELISTKDSHIKELEATIKKINEKLADAELSRTSESEHVKSLRDKIAEIEAKLEQSPSPEDLESAQQLADKQTELVKELERKIDEINKTNSSDIANMNENIDILTKELNEMKSAEEAQNSLIHELESELKEKEDKTLELKEMLDKANAQLIEKNEHLNVKVNLERQVQNLQEQLTSMAKELTDITTKYEDGEALSNEYKVQISKLEKALEEAKKLSSDKQKTDETLETSESEFKIPLKDNTAQDNLIKSLHEKIIELESAGKSNSDITKYEIEIKELNEKVFKLEEMVAEKSKLIESLKESGTEIKESRQKLEVLQKEKNDLVNEIETLKVKADRYEQYRIEVEEEKKEINSILTKERDARHKAEVQLTNLENHIEELQGAKRSKFMCF